MYTISRECVEEALQALGHIPSTFQGAGSVAIAAKRCKPDSKRGQELWDSYTKLCNDGSEHMSTVRMVLNMMLANLKETEENR